MCVLIVSVPDHCLSFYFKELPKRTLTGKLKQGWVRGGELRQGEVR